MAGKMMKEHLAAAGLKVITNRVSGRAEILPDPENVYIPLEEQGGLLTDIMRDTISDANQASTQAFFGTAEKHDTVFEYVKAAIGRKGLELNQVEFALDFSLTALTNYANAPEQSVQSDWPGRDKGEPRPDAATTVVGQGANHAYLRFGSKGGYLFMREKFSAQGGLTGGWFAGDPAWKPVYVGGKPMRIGSHSIGTSTWNSAEREQQRRKQDRAAAGMGASALNRPF